MADPRDIQNEGLQKRRTEVRMKNVRGFLVYCLPLAPPHTQNMKASGQTRERIITWEEGGSVGASTLGI